MNDFNLIQNVERHGVVSVSADQLATLLDRAETIQLSQTGMSGPIRILSVDQAILVQEQTPEGELLIRAMPSLDKAKDLVQDRLDTYDRMWDGCGCKIDYFGR